MTPPRAWLNLDGMLYPIFETDMHLIMKILKDAMDEISRLTYLDEDLRILRLPMDFYETAVLNYAKIFPFKSLLGADGLNNFREGDVIVHIDFAEMTVCSQILEVPIESKPESQKVAVI
jgi:hypothetical protein